MAMEVGGTSRILPVNQVIDKEELLQMQQQIHQIYMKESVYRYLLELITETRSHPCLERGASPRGTIALVKTAKAIFIFFCGLFFLTISASSMEI